MRTQHTADLMQKIILNVVIFLFPVLLFGQNYVQWADTVNCTANGYGTIRKKINNTDYCSGGESKQRLAIGQDGWVEFTLREASYRKTIGLSFLHSSSACRDSIAYGFAFNLSNAGRIRKYTSGGARDTSKTFTYALNDKFRIEKVGTKILFFKNGVKLDSSTTYPSAWACFVDASIRDYNGKFDSVRTSMYLPTIITSYPDKDAYVHTYDTTALGGSITAFTSRYVTAGIAFKARSLMQIDYSQIPQNARIVSTKLYLYSISPGHRLTDQALTNEARIYPLKTAWNESAIKWSNCPLYHDTVYSKVPKTSTSGYPIYQDYIVNLDKLSQYWINGKLANYGFIMKQKVEDTLYNQLYFASSDYTTDVSKKPKVEITYTIGTNYFVNDNSRTGDVYCKAVGSSSNNGLSPYKPKASVSDVINTYPLGPKDTIFVDAGSYTDAITFTSNDCGSALGQLVLCGAGKDKTIITASASNHNLYLNNADYVTVQNLKLNSTQTGSYYNIYNLCSEKIVIQNDSLIHSGNMNLYFYSDPTSINGTCTKSKIDNNNFISKSADKKNIQVTGTCDSLYIRNNTVSNTYNKSIGIQLNYVQNVSYYAPINVFISNNTLAVDSIGILINGHSSKKIDNLRIKNNTITIANTDSLTSGLYINYSGTASSNIDSIAGNTLIGGRYGLYLNYTTYARAINNYFINNQYGTRLANSTTNYFYFNSFNNSRNNLWGSNNTTPSGTYFTNNICTSTGSSSYSNIMISGSSPSLFAAMDYNDFYGPNGAKVAVYNGASYTSLTNWSGISHASSGNDAHSISANPIFPTTITNNLEIDLFSPCTQAGNSVSGITADKNGRVRRSLPSIGAFEPKLKVFITDTRDSSMYGADNITLRVLSTGIDTTVITPAALQFSPDIPLSGVLEFQLKYTADTSMYDTSRVGIYVNSLGRIDSVFVVKNGQQLAHDHLFHNIVNDRILTTSVAVKQQTEFAVPVKTLDGSYYKVYANRLRFVFEEKMNTTSSDFLNYRIYNMQRVLVGGINETGTVLVSGSPIVHISNGKKSYTINLSTLSLANGQYYQLELINKNNEVYKLRFKK